MRNKIKVGEWYRELSTLPMDLHHESQIDKISNETSRQYISTFLETGVIIMRNIIPKSIVEPLKKNISTGYGGTAYCNYWGSDGEKKYEKFTEKALRPDNEMKILDSHYFDEAAQSAIFHSTIQQFLNIFFGTTPLAFQSLGFTRGSGQPVHDDRTFVKVNPVGNFIASWIALEDVKKDTGELIYYPESHRLPPHRFTNGSIWDFSEDTLENYTATLIKKAENAGLSPVKFYPNAGDVLFWHSGLLHGGTKYINKDASRKSLVTHYCPSYSAPPYMQDKEKTEFDIKEVKCGADTIGLLSTGYEEIKNIKL